MGAKRAKRTRLSPDARRAQLLAIGLDLLKREPVEHLTVDLVASEAGVSRGLVFHYFPTVRDLHLACLQQAATELFELVAASAQVPDDERFKGGLGAFVDFIIAQPRIFVTMAAVAASDPDFGRVLDGIRAWLADLLRAQASGEIDPLDDLLVMGWVSFVEASVVRWLEDDSGVEREGLIEALEEVIVPVLARSS